VSITDVMVDQHAWDGITHSYRPPPGPAVLPASLRAFDEIDPDLDPITFEVVRHRLWMNNLAQGETITKIAVSPVLQAMDFNMCVLTEDAELVMNGPYTPILTVGAALLTKYVIERLSGPLGVNDGDVFASNDPWVSSIHQMDMGLVAPVFVDGRLFAWIYNAGHQIDLGGFAPGGFIPDSRDIYSDPVVLPPFKLVERGVTRPDLEQLYVRQSRIPAVVTLDLHAQLAGIRFGVAKLLEVCAEFGAPTVKAVMRRILDLAQRSFQEKLEKIPDGRWSQVRYCDESLPGDRTTHRIQVNMTKSGDRLMIDNDGTDPQTEGPNGFPFTGFAGGVMAIISVTMLHEHLFAVAGAERQIDFSPQPGLLTCCDHPAALSGGILNQAAYVKAVTAVFARMLACDKDLKLDGLAPESDSAVPMIAGVDDHGRGFGVPLSDGQAIGSGARAFKDGIDHGGMPVSMLMKMNNAEMLEQFYPVVYLYRRRFEDSGGPGRWRGGTGVVSAVTPHGIDDLTVSTFTGGMAVSTHGAPGVFGGYPSPTAQFLILKDTNLSDVLESGLVPTCPEDVKAQERLTLRAKSSGTHIGGGDMMVVRHAGAGGYGDPLEREPWRVAEDVASGAVSRTTAHDVYGVECLQSGGVEAAQTQILRQKMREERLGWPLLSETVTPDPIAKKTSTGEAPRLVHEYVISRDQGEFRVLACALCDSVIGDYRANYKLGLRMDESPMSSLPHVDDPKVFLDEDIVFRRYCCPECAVLMSTEIVRASEPPLVDMVLF
jgi:N-methylhydantoinase B